MRSFGEHRTHRNEFVVFDHAVQERHFLDTLPHLREILDRAEQEGAVDPDLDAVMADFPHHPIEFGGVEYGFYAARFRHGAPGKNETGIAPVYHPHHTLLRVQSGVAEIHKGRATEEGTIEWTTRHRRHMGEKEIINPREVYLVTTLVGKPVDAIMIAPPAHFVPHTDQTPEGGKHVIRDASNAFPPHFIK